MKLIDSIDGSKYLKTPADSNLLEKRFERFWQTNAGVVKRTERIELRGTVGASRQAVYFHTTEKGEPMDIYLNYEFEGAAIVVQTGDLPGAKEIPKADVAKRFATAMKVRG